MALVKQAIGDFINQDIKSMHSKAESVGSAGEKLFIYMHLCFCPLKARPAKATGGMTYDSYQQAG